VWRLDRERLAIDTPQVCKVMALQRASANRPDTRYLRTLYDWRLSRQREVQTTRRRRYDASPSA
jgi:hypothetical protein